MAQEINPNDPNRPLDPMGGDLTDDGFRRQTRLEHELQADPELGEGSAGNAKIAVFAVAIALVLGAVFYGLNNSSVQQASTSPMTSTAQNTAQSPQAAPPGMRDVTPRANTEPGMTTGAAPAQPQTSSPPASDAAPSPAPASK